MEPLLVSDDLDRNRLAGAVVATVQHLSERSLAQGINDFVAVCQVVVQHYEIVSAFVVVAVVVCRVVGCCHLFLAPGANIVYRFVVQDLLALVLGEVLYLARLEDG